MRNTTITLLLAFTGTIALSSCSKYEDGPAISLRSKTERLSNNWQVEKAYDNGSDVTSSFDQYRLEMLSGGSAALAALYSIGDLNFEFETTGTWELVNSNEDLRLDLENDAADRTYEILRLKEDELWVREKGGSLELHLEPA
ncbi:MAG: DUF5004 domain-containing protein [Flavobacteriales bacterium]